MARLLAVYPVSEEDTSALPVKTLDRAIAFYCEALGFSVLGREVSAARLSRDAVQVGLVVNRP
jgi:catechol 2,3-dioxygenase-like lactoylglutathione lyase family enzyme